MGGVLAHQQVLWLGMGVDVVDGGSIGEGDRLVGQQGVILVYFYAWDYIGAFYDGAGLVGKVILVSSRILQVDRSVRMRPNIV